MDSSTNTEPYVQESSSRTVSSNSSMPEQVVPECSIKKDACLMQSLQEFSKFCCLRSIPKDVKERAEHYLQNFTALQLTDYVPEVKELFALIIYLAVIETRNPYGPSDPHIEQGTLGLPSISVTDILQMTGVHINRLFQTLTSIKEKTTVPNTVLTHLKKIEKNYCVVAALFHTFESRVCKSVFRDVKEDGEEEGSLPPIPETEGVAFRKKQCWILFLLSRYHLFRDNPDLYPHFQLLLCCVEFVLRQTPSFLLNSPYDSIRFGCYNTQEAGVTMLGKLAEEFQIASDGTLQLHLDRTEPFFQSLLNKDGELDSDSLCEEYEKIYHKEGDLDELQFLTKETHLMPMQMNKLSRVNNNQSGIQTKLMPGQMTPVRLAVSTVDLLHKNFGAGPEAPTEKLEEYFKKCEENPGSKIQGIMKSLRVTFVKAYQAVMKGSDSAIAVQRFTLGLKIYYTVLEALLNSEADKLSISMLSTLLNREDFHKSLLACGLEVVITTYGQTYNHNANENSSEESALAFPWLLGCFSLAAYDFYKVIESFVRIETRLPADVVKHLHNVETRILESDAWREGSPVFDALSDQQKAGTATPPRLVSPISSPVKLQSSQASASTSTVSGKPQPSHTAISTISTHAKSGLELFLSPVKRDHRHDTPTKSTATSVPSTSSTQCASNGNTSSQASPAKISTVPRQSQSLNRFISRVCRLGFSRMSKLCTQLECSKDLQQKIWTCLEHCVTKMPFLLKNRHLDQIIMCCIYGLCKVTEHEMLFKVIVSLYRDLPHARQEICKEVYISEGRYESVINFYNNVFMVNIKSYLLQFAPNTSAKPKLSPMPRQAASPHYSLPGNKNFIISPLKESPFKAPLSPSKMTPGTKLLYSFPESIGGLDSAEKIKDFKQRLEMRRIGNPASAKKRLNMDSMSSQSQSKARKAIF